MENSKAIGEWCGPNLPEDLVLLQDGKPWLGIIGHEKMGFWFLLQEERTDLSKLGINLYGFMDDSSN